MPIYDKSTKELMFDFAEQELSEGQIFEPKTAISWFKSNYPKIKSNTVSVHVGAMAVNNETERKHHPITRNSGHDLFYKESDGKYRLWEPDRDNPPIYPNDNIEDKKELLPNQKTVAVELHNLLLVNYPEPVIAKQAYEELAERFVLDEELRNLPMNDGRNHWNNRVQWARNLLYQADILENVKDGVWRLKQRERKKFWVEKTITKNEPHRNTGEHAFGSALWSPQSDARGADTYKNMRLAQPGDVVLHIDYDKPEADIKGTSIVADYADPEFQGIEDTDWSGRPAYRVDLEDFEPLEPPLKRSEYLKNPKIQTQLLDILSKHKGLFFNTKLELNQGCYLTEAPAELVELYDHLYQDKTSNHLPHIDAEELRLLIINDVETADKSELEQKTRTWIIALGENSKYADEFKDDGIIAIGWDYLGDLSEYTSSDEIKDKMIEIEGVENPFNNVKACYEFANVMKPGDLVFIKEGRKKIIGYGVVTGEHRYEPERDYYQNVRDFDWKKVGSWDADDSLITKTLTDVTQYEDFVEKLKRLVGINKSKPKNEAPLYTLDDVDEASFIERSVLENILNTWKRKKNLILQGPPGVGKTYVAEKLGYALIGRKDKDMMRMVQFHQSYSYEDFIQGYKPTEDGFVLKDGVFYSFCREAVNAPGVPHVFIIDEINRGNLSKILGELMMLIEADKRGEKWAMSLTYGDNSSKAFHVPDNVYILGMMNTADRSLSMVDYALRRRFAFFDLEPEINSPKFKSFLSDKGADSDLIDLVIRRTNDLNTEISNDKVNLGPGFQIGHSFFCSSDEQLDKAWLKEITETEIVPLLREYWFDDPDKVQSWHDRLISGL